MHVLFSMCMPTFNSHFEMKSKDLFLLKVSSFPVKDGLPYLFRSFRNKYFYKISLGSVLYFQNKFTSFEKMHGFPINMQ